MEKLLQALIDAAKGTKGSKSTEGTSSKEEKSKGKGKRPVIEVAESGDSVSDNLPPPQGDIKSFTPPIETQPTQSK